MTKIQEFKGHSARVLNMEMGPDGQIVSAAADETLRFWDIFGPPPNRRNSTFGIGDFQAGFSTIR
jgi:cell division cycle protein 20 (cofactor of APC complex)